MLKSTRIAVLALAVAALSFTATQAGAADCYSSGTRSGTIQKLAHKGIFKKSYEGELVQDGIRTKGEAGVTNVWKFSALDPGIGEQLDSAALTGKPVTLRYCQQMWHNALATSTPYVVVEVIPH